MPRAFLFVSSCARAQRGCLPAALAAAAAATTVAAATATAAVAATRTATTATRTATAAASARTVLRFIHAQRATAHVEAIESLHRALRVGLRHLDEAEAAPT